MVENGIRKKMKKTIKFTILILFFYLSFLSSLSAQQRPPISGKRYELLSGIREETREDHSPEGRFAPSMNGKRPSRFLTQNYEYIPRGSHVLVIGAGQGRNAVFLARKGHKVTRVSRDADAVRKTQTLARVFGVRVNTVISDYSSFRSRPSSFDAIISFYRNSSSLREKMQEWLKPEGLLFYEVYTTRQLDTGESALKARDRTLLRPSELLKLFPDMRILKYEEPLHLKNYPARIVVQKKTAQTTQT